MTYEIENGHVYRVTGAVKSLVGMVSYIETTRLDSVTVADVTYTFDLEFGQYVEMDRVEREEPEPTPEPTPEQQRIAQLEDEAALLALELVDTQIRLGQSEADHAALLFELVDKEVL